jgi:hypothetical protein
MVRTPDFEALDNEDGEMTGNEGDFTGTVIPALAPIVQGSRRSNWTWKPTNKYLEGMKQETINLSTAARIDEYDTKYKTFIDDVHLVAGLAQADGDTMYWDQALKQHDAK